MIKLKKIIIFLFIFIVICLAFKGEEKTVLIPKDAIRFRIIANSNDFKDQEMKLNIRKDIEPIISEVFNESTSINETRNLINYKMNNISNIIDNYTEDYDINYGLNYFPEKTYKGVTYPEGNYESLVITLGDGLGDNWWCVLFPPLCLLEASEENYDDYTYSFYIKDVADKYL